MKTSVLIIALAGAVLAGALTWTGASGTQDERQKQSSLPSVGSYANFVKMMKKLEKSRRHFAAADGMDTAASAASGASEAQAPAGHSTTNVQVEGVDEADRVKTDGKYIYQLKGEKLVVTEAHPAGNMRVVWSEDFNAKGMQPRELYVDEQKLTVIGNYYDPAYNYDMTKILVYDLNDRTDMKLTREAEIKGSYLSSRKIGDSLYVVSNLYIHGLFTSPQNKQPDEYYAPSYRDSASSDGPKTIPWEDIRYIPDFEETNYLIIAGIDLSSAKKEMSVNAYLGAGSTIYASTEHLYVSKTSYAQNITIMSEAKSLAGIPPQQLNKNTSIFKFKLADGQTQFVGEGEVEGALLNQFSMDEYKGYFRIATTTGEVWGSGAEQSKNNLFILDGNLKPAGEIRDIAPGERIYSVRFMGDRGYMVTFKKVDPLFVFDLKDPANPVILGKLKIPGYSDYLHPYDENHLIGFGKDTVEAKQGDFAYYQGLKMALFDITDVNHPKEKFVEIIGDRGTDSELLHNHKALLFSKDKNIIAFPVTVAEVPEGEKNSDGTAYGTLSFQGAYVYSLDLASGFKLNKKITHISDEDVKKAGDYFDHTKAVQRTLYIGDALYTISDYKIEAHDMKSFEKMGEVLMP
ncbi:beta-propeller domain-containing protein [Paenibacillus alkalitolerans]|uniref:beta-propeller domain-containing protein n=1 Tax=Paenibacillus alkalitolerans TaxID=2799335 RepID=UPI0018F4CB1C|nr:beta-propeller domain-containing protein [Paenibacillus alkalitolerans]